MEKKNDNLNITFYMDLFQQKYSSSRSFITELDNFGSLCVSIISLGSDTFAYCRSILGLKEFVYKNNVNTDEHILLHAVDSYFRYFVENWDTQINAKYNFFENVSSVFIKTIGYLSSQRTIQPFNDLIQAHVLANIQDFKIQNLKNRFSEINYFYAEEIENFILRSYLDVEVPVIKLPEYNSILEIEVSPEDYDNLLIKDKQNDEAQLKIIHELISTELHVLRIMNQAYYNGILRYKEKLELYKFNEYFRDFENFYNLSKLFVKDLINNFDTFEKEEVDPTLLDIYKIESCNKIDDTKKRDNKIKFVDDTNNTLNESYIDAELSLLDKLHHCLQRNVEYFNNYKKFLNSYGSVIKNIDLKDINKDKLADTFCTMAERLSKYNPLLSRILSFSDKQSSGYFDIKNFLIRLQKYKSWLNLIDDVQYKKEKTWELCIKYHLDDVKGLYIDEVFSNNTKLILLADYVLILDNKNNLIDFLNVKNLDIHENGEKSLFLITNKKVNMFRYYEFEFYDYNMYAIKIKCLSKSIRDRFVFNVRCSKKKYCYSNREILREIRKDNEVFIIPHISQREEDWIFMKYRFIMNEVLKVNEGLEFIDL